MNEVNFPMRSDITRRQLVQTASAAALLPAPIAAAETPPMRNEASDTPKICLELSAGRVAGAIPAISSTGQRQFVEIDHGCRWVTGQSVRGGCRSLRPATLLSFANPKPRTFTNPRFVTKMFAGLISR